MMLLRALTPVIGFASLAQADTVHLRRNQTATSASKHIDVCNPQKEGHGRMVFTERWEPDSHSWVSERLWHAKSGGSAPEEYCDKSRAYKNITAIIFYNNVKEMIRPWNRPFFLNETQYQDLLGNIKRVINDLNATELLAANVSADIFAKVEYEKLFNKDNFEFARAMIDLYDPNAPIHVPVESLDTLKSQFGTAGGVERFMEEAWARDGTCVPALSLDCYENYADFEYGQEVVAYVERLATTSHQTYEKLEDAGIVPSEEKTYAMTKIEKAIKGNLAYARPTFVCESDVLIAIRYYYKVEGHFDQSVFETADPESEESKACPANVRYLSRINAPTERL
ncbi:hypothetical protein CDD83_7150 [Cordyceps sp. RAO-2017]|nr:hypothetical protein CDD83_7150 [Cordyceps sp. RAO-2017]